MTGRRDRIRRYYERRISPARANFDVLDWASESSQQARFEALLRNVDLADKSLLDVGCGLGDLYKVLKQREPSVKYTGVDLAEKMVQAARRQHPEARFECGDVFAADAPALGEFDVVFCSGIFNLDLGNNAEFLSRAVVRLLELARRCVVFNLLHKRAKPMFTRYFYFDPNDVRQMLTDLPCRCRILDDYLFNDFTVVCEKTPA